MKKFAALTILALAGMFGSTVAQADTLGLHAGVDFWNTTHNGESVKKDGTTYHPDYDTNIRPGFYVAFEHPIPMVPNVMLRYQDLDTDGSSGGTHITSDQQMYDGVFYYQLFDNTAFGLDYGLNIKHFEGTIHGAGSSKDYTKTIPTVYLAANVNLPMTGVQIFGNTSLMHFDGDHVADTEVGISYDVLPMVVTDLQLRAGYRILDMDLDDADGMDLKQTAQGWFMGVGLHF
ncbi:TIGR04219 family outer membrane beta-barrel protein [Celerinatantimonas sp. MCCC 1A17872]|uniref:TIGR04219 family outer membrane beta-barrel protein n=1 Tax=Celerinatantimonas sp. MCCC 1A17872 TaxID=3177514 RepID=UPI0038CB7597